MPRGIGKTTLANGAQVFMGCYKVRKFVLKIGETATHAETQLMNCRKEFEFNNKIITLFGALKGMISGLKRCSSLRMGLSWQRLVGVVRFVVEMSTRYDRISST